LNHLHAREAALRIAHRHAGKSYEQLAALVAADHEYHRIELAGAIYQVTFEVFWDDRPNGLLRVCVAVDDGGLLAFVPLVLSNLVAPTEVFDGTLQ
jgi:hypothetical protein